MKRLLLLLISLLLIFSACGNVGEYECQQCWKATDTLYDDYYCAECFLQSDEYYKCSNCLEYFDADNGGCCGIGGKVYDIRCPYCDSCCAELHKYECSICNERFGGEHSFYVNDLIICNFCFEDFIENDYIDTRSLECDILKAEAEFWADNIIEPKI